MVGTVQSCLSDLSPTGHSRGFGVVGRRGSLSAAGRRAGSGVRSAPWLFFHLYGARPKSFADTAISFIRRDFRGLSESPRTQLPSRDGVETSVSTAALDRGMLMAADDAASVRCASRQSVAGGEAPSDAEIMLRAKAGDQSAFDYLVQKYRRPMVSFMYRMARNAAAAEDLAQEVFLRVYRSRRATRPARSLRPGCIASRRTWR